MRPRLIAGVAALWLIGAVAPASSSTVLGEVSGHLEVTVVDDGGHPNFWYHHTLYTFVPDDPTLSLSFDWHGDVTCGYFEDGVTAQTKWRHIAYPDPGEACADTTHHAGDINHEGLVTLTVYGPENSVFCRYGGSLPGTAECTGESLDVCPNVPARKVGGRPFIVGTAEAETLTGTPAAEIICGLGGHDTIRGGGGDDILYGNDGADLLVGGPEEESSYGGPGEDTIRAGGNPTELGPNQDFMDDEGEDFVPGLDYVRGGGGRDHIFGQGGSDVIEGGDGGDEIVGSDARDFIEGGDGADEIDGFAGHDDLSGDLKGDTIRGGDGNDSIDGGAGNDKLLGNDHADAISGSEGDDTVDGGPGSDEKLWGDYTGSSGPFGTDTIRGGPGEDKLFGEAKGIRAGVRDFLYGGDNADEIYGNGGADDLHGQNGNDTLRGGRGRDSCVGGPDRDSCIGGPHDDTFAPSCEVKQE